MGNFTLQECSNCTLVELKQNCKGGKCMKFPSSNCTLVELKRRISPHKPVSLKF